jgi:hypothetical protein
VGACIRPKITFCPGSPVALPGCHICRAWRWRGGARAVLAQRDVDAKTNQITQVKPLLADLGIAGALVTADALHVQRENRPLPGRRQEGRLPFTAVKDNQPGLFAALDALDRENTPVAHAMRDRGHGPQQDAHYPGAGRPRRRAPGGASPTSAPRSPPRCTASWPITAARPSSSSATSPRSRPWSPPPCSPRPPRSSACTWTWPPSARSTGTPTAPPSSAPITGQGIPI